MSMLDPSVEILLVEDDPRDVDLTLRALKRNNLANRVEVARDGQEALDLLLGEGEHEVRSGASGLRLVLLDLRLPKVDGLEVLRRIRGDKRTRSLPVVVLTSSSADRDMVESYRLGVNSFVKKPVDFGEFVECVSRLGLYWLVANKVPR